MSCDSKNGSCCGGSCNCSELRQENKELKEYCNAISEIIKDFLPVCPAKVKKLIAGAIKKSRYMVCNIKAENEKLKAENEKLKV